MGQEPSAGDQDSGSQQESEESAPTGDRGSGGAGVEELESEEAPRIQLEDLVYASITSEALRSAGGSSDGTHPQARGRVKLGAAFGPRTQKARRQGWR